MTNLIDTAANSNQPLTMSSKEIAELLDVRHDNVCTSIKRLQKRQLIQCSTSLEEKFGSGRPATIYHLEKRDSYIVVAQLSPEFTARLVDRWQELEEQVQQGFQVPQNFREALLLAANQQEQIDQQQKVITEQAPKVEALQRLEMSDGSLCITDAAKTLNVQPKKLFTFMHKHRWIYRRHGSPWIGHEDKIRLGYLEHSHTTVTRADGSEKTTSQVRVTPKGLARLAEMLNSSSAA